MAEEMKPSDSDLENEAEIARRRDAALLKALNTPHKKQVEMKLGKRRTGKRAPKREVDKSTEEA